jgi:hypothetical protein
MQRRRHHAMPNVRDREAAVLEEAGYTVLIPGPGEGEKGGEIRLS